MALNEKDNEKDVSEADEDQYLRNFAIFLAAFVLLCFIIPSILVSPLLGSANFGDQAFGVYCFWWIIAIILFHVILIGKFFYSRIK